MRSLSPTLLASLVFIAALSSAIIFIRVGSAIGSSDARIVYTGNEALANLIWVVAVALVVGAVAIKERGTGFRFDPASIAGHITIASIQTVPIPSGLSLVESRPSFVRKWGWSIQPTIACGH